jgi:hypothetical protein
LHADLDRLQRAEGHVGEEFGRCGCAEEDQGAVRLWEERVAVQVLEVLVETIFAGALKRVA